MAADSDAEARARLERLWHDHYDTLLAYAARRVPEDVAADAVGDTFLVAWRRLDAIPAEPLPWLIGVTRKSIANRRRAGTRLTRLRAKLATVPPESAPDPAERGDTSALAQAYARLSAADREAIALTAWEDLSPTDAAATLGCSVSAYHVRLHRARGRLRSYLAEIDDTSGAPQESIT